MTIENFANEVISVLQERFPKVFDTAEFQIARVNKPGNVVLTGISIISSSIFWRRSNSTPFASVLLSETFAKCAPTVLHGSSMFCARPLFIVSRFRIIPSTAF